MSENTGEEGKGPLSIDVALAKETDRAVGDVIRALFLPPASELGNLLGDAIGLASDVVRRKRLVNARLGMEEVRERLAQAGVNPQDIVPPKEEDLHLLLEGLSLADDSDVRKLWTGLFASALEPGSGVAVERPFISVLQSLTPMDAKVIDFLAFVQQTDQDQRVGPGPHPKEFSNPTPEEVEELKEFNRNVGQRRMQAIATIKTKAKDYGLDDVLDKPWSENLLRQGLIQRSPVKVPYARDPELRSMDERGMLQFMQEMAQKIHIMGELSKRSEQVPTRLLSKMQTPGTINLELVLSPFGQRLAHACGLIKDPA